MTKQPDTLDDAPTDPAASKPRRRLLKLLRRSDTPLDVYQLSDATGLHITTVRFHLDVLARAGQIIVQKTPRSTPGRPRTVYAARTEEAPPDGYRPLAAVLAANFGPTPRTRRRRAEKVGQDWAASLIPAADPVATTDEAAQRIVDVFAEMNFDPELADPASDIGEREIRLRACPYRDVARAHPDVVCAIHLGLLQGALTQLGNPPTGVRLLPFVKPHLCLAYLTPQPPSGVPSAPDDVTNDRKTRESAMNDRPSVRVRRVYDEPAADDGKRVLVDRLWPRGMSKDRAQLDEWCKTVAPSSELRTWYHHEPERFEEFTRRYLDELGHPERADALAHLRELSGQGSLTLLTATKSTALSEAAVLADLLTGSAPDGGTQAG
jgi:uncharacterized protein YeaO (DUF488 family)/predicted ArsR family transcriptional regulator